MKNNFANVKQLIKNNMPTDALLALDKKSYELKLKPQYYLLESEAHISLNQLSLAEIALLNGIKSHPTNSKLMLTYCRFMRKQGKLSNYFNMFYKVELLNEKTIAFCKEHILFLLAKGNYKKAKHKLLAYKKSNRIEISEFYYENLIEANDKLEFSSENRQLIIQAYTQSYNIKNRGVQTNSFDNCDSLEFKISYWKDLIPYIKNKIKLQKHFFLSCLQSAINISDIIEISSLLKKIDASTVEIMLTVFSYPKSSILLPRATEKEILLLNNVIKYGYICNLLESRETKLAMIIINSVNNKKLLQEEWKTWLRIDKKILQSTRTVIENFLNNDEIIYTQHNSNSAGHVLVFTGLKDGVMIPLLLLDRILSSLNLSAIYIRDMQRNMGLSGIKQLASGFSLTVKQLENILTTANAKKTYVLSSSAGGFAAIKYGLALNASKILCFSPPGKINLESETRGKAIIRRLEKNFSDEQLDAVTHIKASHSKSPISIIYGEKMEQDKLQAEHLSGCNQVKLQPIAGLSGHESLQHMYAEGGFCELLKNEFNLKPEA